MSSQVFISEDLKLGTFVEVVSLIGKPVRSLCGLSASVSIGDQGQIVEIFKEDVSGRLDDYRVISMDGTGELVWEANFQAEELRPINGICYEKSYRSRNII